MHVDDVRVLQPSKESSLSLETLPRFRTVQPLLEHDLEREPTPKFPILHVEDFAHSTRAEVPSNAKQAVPSLRLHKCADVGPVFVRSFSHDAHPLS